jgi:hypothetical protein
MKPTRPLSELLATDEPAWPMVLRWIADAKNAVEVLPPGADAGDVLHAVQVTVRSPMGAIAYHSGGLLVDHGWIRILGSGHPKLPRSLPTWNHGKTTEANGEPGGFYLVADDAIGGFFAIDGGALGDGRLHIHYFAPDSLRWDSLEQGYSAFLDFCLNGDLEDFYKGFRWPGWQDEVATMNGVQAMSFYPPLWTNEGKDVTRVSRRAIPIDEVYLLNVIDIPRQLGG